MKTLTPARPLSGLLTDWLRPDSLLDRGFFNFDKDLMFAKPGINVPSVNIRETEKEFILELAAPGLQRSDFEIELDQHNLTISAEKEEESEEEKDEYARREYSYNSFSRSFTLPENVKESAIDARYDKGILTVTVPKLKQDASKPAQKITVS